MDAGLSIQIVWPLSAQEAINTEFEFIEPDHLFNAVLKFAELDNEYFQKIIQHSDALGMLSKERDAVRKILNDHSINVPTDSTKIRRTLRSRLGKGMHPYNQQRVIHRSDAARKVCTTAEEIAHSSNERYWTSGHLLEALFSTPSSLMVSVFAEAGLSNLKQPMETPFLDKFGRDITELAKDGKLKGIQSDCSLIIKDPVCKVVINEMLGKEKNNVLLIQKGKRSPKEVVECIAQLFVSNLSPSNARGKRIVEIDVSSILNDARSQKKFEEIIYTVFQEASKAGNVILYLSKFHNYLEANSKTDITELLKQTLPKKVIPFIGTTDENNYLNYIKADALWNKLFHSVWIHDLDLPVKL